MVYLDMDIRKLIKNYQTPPNGQEIIKCGNILLIAGVSGAGKDSIKHKLVSGKKYGDIISHTTRPPHLRQMTRSPAPCLTPAPARSTAPPHCAGSRCAR